MKPPESRLSRRLGVGDAVTIGLGAMFGAGVFVAWQPAAARAGAWLLLSLALAALVATCNATSTARLAAVHPRAGGAYEYGREELGRPWGALAGYAFVFGKTASCATAALAVGAYLWPEHDTAVALAAIAVVTSVNVAGVTKTAGVTKFLVAVVVVVLAAVVVAVFAGAGVTNPVGRDVGDAGFVGVLSAAAVLFYAFAGYARITVLAEEVRDPRTIPRAVAISLTVAFVLYALVGVAVLLALSTAGVTDTPQPLRAAAETVDGSWLVFAVTVGAAAAALGALLSLQAGIGRTAFAMAAGGDLPSPLAAVEPTRRTPQRAELAAAALTAVAVLAGDLGLTLAASSFAVLVYYAIANAAAWRLPGRRLARAAAAFGFLACLSLAASLSGWAVLVAAAALAVAMSARGLVTRRRLAGS